MTQDNLFDLVAKQLKLIQTTNDLTTMDFMSALGYAINSFFLEEYAQNRLSKEQIQRWESLLKTCNEASFSALGGLRVPN